MKLVSDIAIIDVTGVKQFPVVSPKENNWKLMENFMPFNINAV